MTTQELFGTASDVMESESSLEFERNVSSDDYRFSGELVQSSDVVEVSSSKKNLQANSSEASGSKVSSQRLSQLSVSALLAGQKVVVENEGGLKRKLPAVIEACFDEYAETPLKQTARCKLCHKVYHDKLTTTSNFVRHIRKEDHKELLLKYEELITQGAGRDGAQQNTLQEYVMPVEKFRKKDPTQVDINKHVINAVIQCCLPLSIVDNVSFRELLTAAQPKYVHMTRKTAAKEISKQYVEQRRGLMLTLDLVNHVSLTVDIWTDRKMRSFLGVTAHFVEDSAASLTSAVLCCKRFHGRHTAENIKEAFDICRNEYLLAGKVGYIVSDNAANMAKAFHVTFPGLNEETVENEDLWSNTDNMFHTTVSDMTSKHLRCFAHTLQLVVKDGLKESGAIYLVLGKCSKLASTLHTSSSFKEAFEQMFGKQVSITQPISTRWNSMMAHVSSILKLDQLKLWEVLKDTNRENLSITPKEWGQLQELENILKPFLEATTRTQGEKGVTISFDIIRSTCVLMIEKELSTVSVKYLTKVQTGLKRSLNERFEGILDMMTILEPSKESPFSDDIYTLSTVLDVTWGMPFFQFAGESDNYVHIKERIRRLLLSSLNELELGFEVENRGSQEDIAASQDSSSMFSEFLRRSRATDATHSTANFSAAEEVDRFLNMTCNDRSALKFWENSKTTFPRLRVLALKLLSVPATSAPIERTFSTGGLVMTAKRGAMSAELLEELVFLRCNRPT